MKNLLPLFTLLLAFACSQPRSTESFIRGEGPYEFTVDMTDSTSAYSFDLFTRIDATEFPARLPLNVKWLAPEGSSFTEIVYLPVERGSAFFSQESCRESGRSPSPFPTRRKVFAAWGWWCDALRLMFKRLIINRLVFSLDAKRDQEKKLSF